MPLVPILLAILAAPPAHPREAAPACAIVSSLSGTATRTSHRRTVALRLFDWLGADAVVRTDADTRVVLTLTSGKRYEIGEKADVTVTATVPKAAKGSVLELEPLPALPPVPVVDAQARPGARTGAVRVRGTEWPATLYPDEGAAVLADAVVLRFDAAAPEIAYRVEIEDEGGRAVHAADGTATVVTVPPHSLQPGASYHWTVRTLPKLGPALRAQAEFVTLPAETARQLRAFELGIKAAGDTDSLALLAAVERGLGRTAEAQLALAEACARPDASAALREACVP